MTPHLDAALIGFANSIKWCLGSGTSFVIANTTPDEDWIIKTASTVTGWVLALVCIYVLCKTVKVLFAKLEERDGMIRDLLAKETVKADRQREDMLDELKQINGKAREEAGKSLGSGH